MLCTNIVLNVETKTKKQFLYKTCAELVFFGGFNEQSLVILWVNCSGIPEFRPFGQKGKFSAFGLRFRPPKLKAEYGRNSRKALDFLLFVHENIANVNYQW